MAPAEADVVSASGGELCALNCQGMVMWNRLSAVGARAVVCATAFLCTPACQMDVEKPDKPDAARTSTVRQALGQVIHVGPTRTYTTLADVRTVVTPGDVVLVDYGTYSTAAVFTVEGTAANPITIRGCLPGMADCISDPSGKRPLIKAGINVGGQIHMVRLEGDHYTFENFEIDLEKDQGNLLWSEATQTGNAVAVRHQADGITLRNLYIHDCPGHGVLGHDDYSGSITIEYSEFAKCGDADRRHSIYVTSNDDLYPNAVFRLQHSYLHQSQGGNMVKSRAARNEIYYNWIENGFYRELELIGRDWERGDVERHSDVVGNVLLKTTNPSGSGFANVRVGHDQEDSENIQLGTRGRTRFVNNTFVMPNQFSAPAIQTFERLESVEMHNNVFYRIGGGALRVLFESDPTVWTLGSRRVGGTYNWVPSANTSADTPPEWTTTRSGTNPGFVDQANGDYRISSTSPLINMGSPSAPSTPNVTAFPNPQWPPTAVPPLHVPTTSPNPRPVVGIIDIGAFESGTGTPCTYQINPTTANAAAAGGTGSFTVTAPSGCTWNAASNATWLVITSGASGSGSGTVAYSVTANTGTARNAAISLQSASHTVSQDGASGGSGGTIDVYRDQTASQVTFVGGSTGVQATIAPEGIGGSNAIKHENLQIWDATKRLVLPTPIDITNVTASDKLRISLDVSAGRASNIYVYFNNDWETFLITPILDQAAGFETFEITIGDAMRARLGNSVNEIYFKAGSGFPDSGTLKVDDIQFVTAAGGGGEDPPPSGGLVDVYINQTDLTFDGGSTGVSAAIALTEGLGGSPAVKHSNLQIWDTTKRMQLASAVDISAVLATDKLRISLDVSAGRASNIYVYFNGDWQTYLVTPVLDQLPGYQTFDVDIGSAMRTRMGSSINGIYFKAGSGFPDSGTLWVDEIKFIRP